MGGYLRQHQIEEIENEKRVIERTLQNQRDIQDRGNLQSHLRRCEEQISRQAPPDLTPEERDQAARECREIEERLVPMMPSDEEMRRNPAGVVGQHKRYEKASKSKDYFPEGDIFRWKQNMLALHKGDEDPDVANFERLRPLHNHGSMLGAEIPGQQYFGTNPSPNYLAGYDRTFGSSVDDEKEVEDEATPERVQAVRKKKPAKKKASGKAQQLDTLPCGKKMGKNGRHFHVAKCEICQEAAE